MLAALGAVSCQSLREAESARVQPADSEGSNFSSLYSKQDERALAVGSDISTLKTQLGRASNQANQLRAELGQTEDEDEREDMEDRLELVEFVEDWLRMTLNSMPTERQVLSANVQTERILNAVDESMRATSKDNYFDATKNFIFTSVFGHSLPDLAVDRQSKPIGLRRAAGEAKFLPAPGGDRFLSAGQLATMSPEEVSGLDISGEHPGWYRDTEFRKLRANRLIGFESWMEDGVGRVLQQQGDLAATGNWDVAKSRKVLFLDEIYKSATSAKGSTEDAFGVEWKIKWGDEVHAEAVSTRLYLLAGAKMTDLVYAGGGGPGDMVLVLCEEGKYEPEKAQEGAEREPETLAQLSETLKDFYGFEMAPYVHSHGVITRENVGSVLRNLPVGGKKKYRAENLIGRHWVSFREYLVELHPDGFVRREDGAAMSDFAANNDRVARSLYLLSLWMSNRDVKDNNNKSFFVRRGSDRSGAIGDITDYFEGHHDLGVTLGTMGSSGEINGMQTGDEFMKRGLFGQSLRFRQTYIYRPEAWAKATWADCKWMARKIGAISEPEIREAVAASEWPDFMQESLTYKLLERRNRIATMYGLTEMLDHPSVRAPNIAIPLGNGDEIAAAEKRYELKTGSLAAALADEGRGPGYSETLVYQGQISDSRTSSLIRLLVQQRHPAGLDDRYRRLIDKHPRGIE